MKNLKLSMPFWAVLSIGFIVASCGNSKPEVIAAIDKVEEHCIVNGAKFKMVTIPASTFGMGKCVDGRLLSGSDNLHQVLLDSYAISEYPVSQALWKAVMRSNPSAVAGDNYPVSKVDIKDCHKFVKKLSKMTGIPFYLPTEAQWEYAVNYGYVKTLKNVEEWCGDSFSSVHFEPLMVNPRIFEKSSDMVVRNTEERRNVPGYTKSGALTFRLAVNLNRQCADEIVKMFVDEKPIREHTAESETFRVNGTSFQMIGVRGGEFFMGAGSEQGNYATDDEKPAHLVKVEGFSIGKYEVTVGLWKAVMGSLPYGNEEDKVKHPVVNVSWYSAQEFIMKLNQLTGRHFRLPTEAEWEYAARGAQKMGGFRFSGNNNLKMVGAYAKNSKSIVQPVGSFLRNGLGLYDMSGNVWEWCQDQYAEYGKKVENPLLHVIRGGSAASPWEACRVTNRSKIPANNVKSTFGFRLAL